MLKILLFILFLMSINTRFNATHRELTGEHFGCTRGLYNWSLEPIRKIT